MSNVGLRIYECRIVHNASLLKCLSNRQPTYLFTCIADVGIKTDSKAMLSHSYSCGCEIAPCSGCNPLDSVRCSHPIEPFFPVSGGLIDHQDIPWLEATGNRERCTSSCTQVASCCHIRYASRRFRNRLCYSHMPPFKLLRRVGYRLISNHPAPSQHRSISIRSLFSDLTGLLSLLIPTA